MNRAKSNMLYVRGIPAFVKRKFEEAVYAKGFDMADVIEPLMKLYVKDPALFPTDPRTAANRVLRRVSFVVHDVPWSLRDHFRSVCVRRGDTQVIVFAALMAYYAEHPDCVRVKKRKFTPLWGRSPEEET